jgi:hypothetical protein
MAAQDLKRRYRDHSRGLMVAVKAFDLRKKNTTSILGLVLELLRAPVILVVNAKISA